LFEGQLLLELLLLIELEVFFVVLLEVVDHCQFVLQLEFLHGHRGGLRLEFAPVQPEVGLVFVLAVCGGGHHQCGDLQAFVDLLDDPVRGVQILLDLAPLLFNLVLLFAHGVIYFTLHVRFYNGFDRVIVFHIFQHFLV